MNRRQFIAISAATAASTATVSCSGRSAERPEGVPVGPFGNKSTAEEVSAGLDLTGKTALVTGSNSGIGYETARVLALRGAHVICAARTVEKAQTTSDSIAGDTSPSVFDLADWDSISDAAAIIRATGKPIDILVLNAGIMELPELQQVHDTVHGQACESARAGERSSVGSGGHRHGDRGLMAVRRMY